MTLLDLKIDDKLDSYSTLEFELPASDPKASLVVADAMVEYGGEIYYISEIDQVRDGTKATTRVTALQLWNRLAERRWPGAFTNVSVTMHAGLDAILAPTGWTRGGRTSTTGVTVYSYDAQDETYLKMLREWAVITNTVVVFNTVARTVDLIPAADRGRTIGIGFRYGRNLTQIERHIEPPKVTRLYPYGANDLNITGLTVGGVPYIEDYSFYTAQGVALATAQELYRKDEVWSNTDIVDEDALYAAAATRLADLASGTIEYKMAVADLSSLTGVSESDIRVGDIVRVRDTILDFDVETTVVRYEKYPLQPWQNRVELAYLYDPADPTNGSSPRPNQALNWEMFQSRSSQLKMRNSGTYIACRIPLTFSGDAEAVYGVDVSFVGVGTGSMRVSAIDAEAGTLEHDILVLPYTHGEAVHKAFTWSHDTADALDTLNGQKDYRVRLQAIPTAETGATASGVDMDAFDARMWILARGAVKQTPVAANSQRFDYTGAVQTFTVPDNVNEVRITAVGSQGGDHGNGSPGSGASVAASFNVLPGQVLDVYVGGYTNNAGGGWPNGGDAGLNIGGDYGGGGGGSSHVVETGGAFVDAWIVAAGGGGTGSFSLITKDNSGGAGGFFTGSDGTGNERINATGATQYSGGLGAADDNYGPGPFVRTDSANGGFNSGGDAYDPNDAFSFPGGGGGGGWYGGGGGGGDLAGGKLGGGGGGGSGWVKPSTGWEIETSDGVNADYGYVIFEWDDPLAE